MEHNYILDTGFLAYNVDIDVKQLDKIFQVKKHIIPCPYRGDLPGKQRYV